MAGFAGWLGWRKSCKSSHKATHYGGKKRICLPMQKTQVWSLPLEKEIVTHSSILAWKIPWTEEPGGLQSMGSQRVRHNLVTEKQQQYTRFTPRKHAAATPPLGAHRSPVAIWLLPPCSSEGKESTHNARNPCSIPELGRSPGEGYGNPLQYSCLENSMDGGAWHWTTVHRVSKSRTWLRN